MIKNQNKEYDDYSVSPVIRQGLQHWAYTLTKSDYEPPKSDYDPAESDPDPDRNHF